MASNRVEKSGFAKEAQDKINQKYNPEIAQETMAWVRDRTAGCPDVSVNANGEMNYVAEVLGDGYVLLRLCERLGIKVNNIKREKMAFKKMESINKFLTAVEGYGVPKMELFQTVDLYERQNLGAVITCLSALARKVQAAGGQGFGPKEAERNSRNFTEEQMKAGQNVIGLQMGSNKGATQAGQNFGKSRMIVD